MEVTDAEMQPERFTLTVEATADPLVRRGERPRPAAYRMKLVLKSLLRGYGFRCVQVRPVPTEAGKAVTQ